MTRRAALEQWAETAEIELVFFDGLDAAIVGIGQRFNDHFVVYDFRKVIDILMTRDGMELDDAIEFFDFNIVGQWVGRDGPPCFLTKGTPG